jgi:hypothetical protein
MIGFPPPEKQSRSVRRWKPGPRSEGVVLGLTKVEVLQVSRALALQLQGHEGSVHEEQPCRDSRQT